MKSSSNTTHTISSGDWLRHFGEITGWRACMPVSIHKAYVKSRHQEKAPTDWSLIKLLLLQMIIFVRARIVIPADLCNSTRGDIFPIWDKGPVCWKSWDQYNSVRSSLLTYKLMPVSFANQFLYLACRSVHRNMQTDSWCIMYMG